MSVPESIAWLETTANHHTPSAAQIYAHSILDELTRLSEALDGCAREIEKVEHLREEALAAQRKLEYTFGILEDKSVRAREEWDRDRTEFDRRLADKTEKLVRAEGVLRDIHFGLLKQPELTREDLALAIESVVTPHPEGAKA